MSDFTLAPDEPADDRPERTRPVRLVGTGLAPTAAVPAQAHKGVSPALCYQPCSCGTLVLTGRTDAGSSIALTPSVPTWVVLCEPGMTAPRLSSSRGYPEHACPGKDRL
jgi:hypothetical protein